MSTDIIPISDEQAKAIQEAAKLGSEGLQTVRAFGGYLREILGTLPTDIIGLVGGDWLRFKRIENIAKLGRRTNDCLKARSVEQPEQVSLSLGLPLLRAAADEDREELVALWAKLLASAMDPNRASRVRARFIQIVQKLDPLDALVLDQIRETRSMGVMNLRDFIANRLGLGPDQIEVSFSNLFEQQLVTPTGQPRPTPGSGLNGVENILLTSTGREFLAVVTD